MTTGKTADGTLSVQVRDELPWTVVTVAGEIDVNTAGALRTALLEAVEERRADLVLDFGSVTFLDSTALGVLVSANRRVRTLGGTVRIVTQAEFVLKVLSLTALDLVFRTYPTLDEALADPR